MCVYLYLNQGLFSQFCVYLMSKGIQKQRCLAYSHSTIASIPVILYWNLCCVIHSWDRRWSEWSGSSFCWSFTGWKLRNVSGWVWKDIWWKIKVSILQLCQQRNSTAHRAYQNSYRYAIFYGTLLWDMVILAQCYDLCCEQLASASSVTVLKVIPELDLLLFLMPA